MASRRLFATALALSLALAAANILLGPLNLDEGWYLYAAKSVAGGALPYRDFFFTQAPAMPLLYGALAGLWSGAGVLGGRILTAILGLAAALLASLLAATAVPSGRKWAAALTTFALTACNVWHSYFTVIPKTYSLAALFTAGAFLSLAAGSRRAGPAARLLSILGGFLLALAAGTRLSLGAMLPVTGLFLLVCHRTRGTAWLFFGIGGAAGLCAIFLPFVIGNFEAFAFANFFHGGRASGGLALMAGSLSRLCRNYMPLALLALATLPLAAARRDRAPSGTCDPLLWLAAFAPVFVVHLLSPFPYDDYQVPVMPLAAAAISALFWQRCNFDGRAQAWLLATLLAGATLFAFTSPVNESWLVLRKDRFWVETKQRPDLLLLRETGRKIAALVPPGAELLTQDTYLAVEAGRKVPHGFEMGPFGYFATLPDDEAEKFNVLNRKLLLNCLATTDAPVAAASGYAFAMSAPELRKDDAGRAALLAELERRFSKVESIPDFGQEHTTLDIYAAKREPGD